MPVNPIPSGYHRVTPYLTIAGATELLQFVRNSCGNRWRMATHVEDVSPEELLHRAQEALSNLK